MRLPQPTRQSLISIIVFLVGLALTIVVIQLPFIQLFISRMSSTGLMGAFIAGVLYAFTFTSSLATVVFLQFPDQINPWLIALIGGVGAAVYDITIFVFVRRQTETGIFQAAYEALKHRRQIPRWLSFIIGIVVLGSPLPDELAAGFLGFMKFSTLSFIIISFVANTLGLLLITSLQVK